MTATMAHPVAQTTTKIITSISDCFEVCSEFCSAGNEQNGSRQGLSRVQHQNCVDVVADFSFLQRHGGRRTMPRLNDISCGQGQLASSG